MKPTREFAAIIEAPPVNLVRAEREAFRAGLIAERARWARGPAERRRRQIAALGHLHPEPGPKGTP